MTSRHIRSRRQEEVMEALKPQMSCVSNFVANFYVKMSSLCKGVIRHLHTEADCCYTLSLDILGFSV